MLAGPSGVASRRPGWLVTEEASKSHGQPTPSLLDGNCFYPLFFILAWTLLLIPSFCGNTTLTSCLHYAPWSGKNGAKPSMLSQRNSFAELLME